jgi:4-amino-4-deoxy-L-arabinose transferase-like glycosyltransferase
MLAKGPVVFLYAGVPIALWTFWQRRLREAWTALPWITGTLLAAVICVPWYALAESRTPGFLSYFLIGEHVMRFLHPGWSGDLYGNAHSEPTGTIWLYLLEALGATAPLLLAAVAASVRRRPAAGWRTALREADPALGFLLLSTLVPLLFFTFAGNIIWTYVLPALGPLAILLGIFCARRIDDRRWRGALWASLALGWLALNVAWIAWVPAHSAARSGAALAQSWREHASADPGPLLYWGRKTPASVRFYARGEVRLVSELAPELARLERGQRVYVIVEPDRVESLRSVVRGVGAGLRVETISVGRREELLEVERE